MYREYKERRSEDTNIGEISDSAVVDAMTSNSDNVGPMTSDGAEECLVDAKELHVEDGIKATWEREQLELKQRLVLEDVADWARHRVTPDNAAHHPGVQPLKYLGGVDISFVKGDNVNACAALVVVELPSLEVVYEDCSHVELTAPYIPGFLAFREVKFLVDKIEKLKATSPEFMPQVVLCDGNGILHPREFGVASHLGVLLDLPALGAAKKLFQVFGLEKDEQHKRKIEQLLNPQDSFPLVGDSGRTLGVALRSNAKTKNPIYISPGHQLTVETAKWVVLQCCPYRVPEPIRQADGRSREFLRQHFPTEENPPKQKSKKSPSKHYKGMSSKHRDDESSSKQPTDDNQAQDMEDEEIVDTSLIFTDNT